MRHDLAASTATTSTQMDIDSFLPNEFNNGYHVASSKGNKRKSTHTAPKNSRANKNKIASLCAFLKKKYDEKIPQNELYCLDQLENTWAQSLPLKNKRVLLNAHLTLATIPLIRLLILAGAEVEITAAEELAVHEDIEGIIEQTGLIYHKKGNIPSDNCKNYYDIVFDCGAGMLRKVTPSLGMVELTHTQKELYSNINFPVITVDTSETKAIETGIGTGNGATRAYEKINEDIMAKMLYSFFIALLPAFKHANSQNQISQKMVYHTMLRTLGLIDSSAIYAEKDILIFGYGKVGRGIANAFLRKGTPANKIHIVDISLEAFLETKSRGYTLHHIDTANPEALNASLNKIKHVLQSGNIHCAITATGVEGVISEHFDPEDFIQVPICMNMGTPDEWGDRFDKELIENEGKPANFMLEYPTLVRYLDPIFAIFALAGLELTTERANLKNGLNQVSKTTDTRVLTSWMAFHNPDSPIDKENIDDLDHAITRIKFAMHKQRPQTKKQMGNLLTSCGVWRKNPARAVTPPVCLTPMGGEPRSRQFGHNR